MCLKPVLAVVHQATSDPGLVGQWLQHQGYDLDIRCAAIGHLLPSPQALENYTGVVMFGGPMSANDDRTLPFIRTELDWLETVLKAQLPFLGICLGAQLLARVLGARVQPHPQGQTEIGYFPIQTAPEEALMSLQRVFHWHKEGFDLPRSAHCLARGETFPNQAFRYGTQAYGLQFHPEITGRLIDRWTRTSPEMLDLPGAQPRQTQLHHHAQYGELVADWLAQFLPHWLTSLSSLSSLPSSLSYNRYGSHPQS